MVHVYDLRHLDTLALAIILHVRASHEFLDCNHQLNVRSQHSGSLATPLPRQSPNFPFTINYQETNKKRRTI